MIHNNRYQRLWGLLMSIVICVGIVIQANHNSIVAVAHPAVHTLSPEQTDMAAHMVGSSWHDTRKSPFIVDFGNSNPNGPVAGMDQWLTAQGQRVAPRSNVIGTKKYLVIRVYFDGESNDSYYAKNAADEDANHQWNVNDDLMKPLRDIYKLTSYNQVTIDWDISNRYKLPNNRNHYIDTATGDSSGACAEPFGAAPKDCNLSQFGALIRDATTLAQGDFNYNNYTGILVLMSDTKSTAAFHRAAATQCNTSWSGFALNGVASNHTYGCIIALENHAASSSSANEKNRVRQELFGRLGHEFGHAFQQGGPAHPSNYNNSFELMDSNYPGHIGAYEKQSNVAFPGWMPTSQYVAISKLGKTQNDSNCIRALEYDPALNPVPQAIKVNITGSLYYMLTVRTKNDGATTPVGNGDELNAHFYDASRNPTGIPSEGLLIERVNESATGSAGDSTTPADPIVTVIPKSGRTIDNLWQKGEVADFFASDGVKFTILPEAVNNPNKQTMCVRISFDNTNSLQPDMAMRPWREAPGETWESTDIWFDSPLNGYGTYRYGYWNDINNVQVPRYNGDIPAAGSVNRAYARVRNVGTKTATDIKVRFQVTDPAGMGINASTNWIGLGTGGGVVDKNTFPALASLAPGAYTDVYVEWKPEFTDVPTTGTFDYHTCVRVKIDPVAGETVTGNQDGNDEQENIFTFEATPAISPIYQHQFTIFNESTTNPITYYLKLDSTLPPNWDVNINNGKLIVALDPNQQLTVPVVITPTGSAVLGSIFEAKISAEKHFDLVNQLAVAADPHNPEAYHAGSLDVGGVSFAVNVLAPTDIQCDAYQRGSLVEVVGGLNGFEGIHQAGTPLRAYAQVYDDGGQPIPLDDRASGDVGSNGVFRMRFSARTDKSPTQGGSPMPKSVRCFFAGTQLLASSSTALKAITNAAPPTPTIVPWLVSEFHSTLNLNQFLAPPSTYSDTVNGAPGNQYECTAGKCPVLVGGRRGRGTQFTNSDSTFLKSNANIALGASFSVGLWAKRNNTNVAETLLSHGDTVATGKMFNMGFTNDGYFVCSTYNDELRSPDTYNDTGWHHFVCVVDGPARGLFIDNVEVANGTSVQAAYTVNNRMLLGRRADRPNSFSGALDEVKIYNYPIGAGTIDSLYHLASMAPVPNYALSFDDIAIPENEGMTTGITASCGGNICPVVYYPDRTVVPRPLERVAAQQLEQNHWITWSSGNAVNAGNEGTLQFWAHLDDNSGSMLPLVIQSVGNRPQIYWRGSSHTLTFNSLTYEWSDFTPTWHMFTFVKTTNLHQIYIDGNKVAEGTAAVGTLPFRVGAGVTLKVGGVEGGELAGVELANWAFPGNYVAFRYTSNTSPSNITPSRTLTVTPTASNTAQPIVTIPAININKTVLAAQVTQNAILTAAAAPFATATKRAQIFIPTFVMAQTQWAGINITQTEAAYALKTPVPTKRPILTLAPIFPTLTVFLFPTRNMSQTATRTTTGTMTSTASVSPTVTATATATATASVTRATRTALPSATITSTATDTATATKACGTACPPITASPTVCAGASPQQCATITVTRSQTAAPTRTIAPSATVVPNPFGPDAVPLNALPKGMLYRVLQHIIDNKTKVGNDWSTTTLGDVAIPFYRPDVDNGNSPAYYEFSVFSDATKSKPAGFIMATMDGAINVARAGISSRHDFPITHWNSTGPAISKQLQGTLTIAPTSSVKLWKLDSLGYVMVKDNQVISNVGAIPALIDGLTEQAFASYSTSQMLSEVKYTPSNPVIDDSTYQYSGGSILRTGPQADIAKSVWRYGGKYADISPINNFSAYASAYTTSFAPLISQLTNEAARLWGVEDEIISPRDIAAGNENYYIPIAFGTTSTVAIPLQGITAKDVTDMGGSSQISNLLPAVQLPAVQTVGDGGYSTMSVTATGPLSTVAVLRHGYSISKNGATVKLFFVMIDNPSGAKSIQTRDWSPWSYYYAGTDADQRMYDQWDLGGCLSGCGPTAWMMLFGWVDYKSSITGSGWGRWNTYRAGGNNVGAATGSTGVAPAALSNDVKNATLYIRNQVGTYCLPTSNSALTYPWSMENARYYLNYVGTGLGFADSYNIAGYHEDRLKNYAINEITNRVPRPVVIGTGWLSHYPLAYKYAIQSRPTTWRDAGWWVGDDYVYNQSFYVNEGWGGRSNGWINAGTWFAGRVSP